MNCCSKIELFHFHDWEKLNLIHHHECQTATIDKWYSQFDELETEVPLNEAKSLLDDLNTPGFIAKIHELYNNANKGDAKSKKSFNSACKLLGLFDLDKKQWDNFKK